MTTDDHRIDLAALRAFRDRITVASLPLTTEWAIRLADAVLAATEDGLVCGKTYCGLNPNQHTISDDGLAHDFLPALVLPVFPEEANAVADRG